MIRIATLIAAVSLAAPAAAQIAEPSLLSPSRLTNESWIPRPAVSAIRIVQETPAPAPSPAVAAPAPAPAATVPTPAVTAPAPAPPAPVPAIAAPTPAAAPVPLRPLAEDSAEPSGPALRRTATVTGDIVRIGDLVDNAGAVADVAIFRAPDLGQTGSVPAGRVREAVRSHHIVSLDTRGLQEVLVTRASRAVDTKEVEARVLRALAAQPALADNRDVNVKNLSASFDSEVRTYHVEPNAELGVTRLSFDARARRFDVTFDLPTATARRAMLRVTGTLVETAEAVVPLRAIAAGEVLKASDVMIERRPKTDVVAIEDVLGFAAKRALSKGQAIRAADLMKPELVARNETVTMSFEAPGMIVTVRATALEAGALGDVINVVNIQSKRTIQAIVSGKGRVTVANAPARVVANAAEPSNPPHQ
jgi:flagella basal body P-ring formation protein FlgA